METADVFPQTCPLCFWLSPVSPLIISAPTGAEGSDVSAAATLVRGGAVQTGPADADHPAVGAAQPIDHPDSHSGGDWSVRLRGASAAGVTAGDQATQLHEQTGYWSNLLLLLILNGTEEFIFLHREQFLAPVWVIERRLL